ncbi:hypothetical protein HUW51_16955 [Adhaeribacter swui]|uniref:Uncharacterized protein n=1 Tax=Adhaeribacter swui TaxID=2086471 RepID=A0A7G7GAZ4_9BACT|nr:hypothetical protein [Adhaeribacter swui]QNF34328.1 hypothetical protein HUW51_16955 [Adhaeribacter swui]
MNTDQAISNTTQTESKSIKKRLIVMQPHNVRENLSAEEWEALLNIIDTLLDKGVKLSLEYHDLPGASTEIRNKPASNDFDEEFGFILKNGYTDESSYLKVKEYAQKHRGYY